MKKKLLATLLCVGMTASLLSGCGSSSSTSTTTDTTETADTSATEASASAETEAAAEQTAAPEAVMAEAEALPDEAFVHITFDGDDEGYTALVQVDDVGDNDGATYGLAATDATFTYTTGVVGQSLYLDGTYGLDLGFDATNTDTYTISFWLNADRLSNYGPTLQIGYDVGKAADAGNDVTWLNITQAEWGDSSAKIFPLAWSRNEASDGADGTDCWPWMYAFDNEIHGKREWVMVTVVCTGEEQTSPLGSTTVGAQYYIDGVKVYDSQDNYTNNSYFEYTWDATLAPNIMQPGDKEFEAYFGINYWDTVFKGYVDDLYVYDTALTAGQVATLYQMGDPDVEMAEIEAAEEEEEATARDHSDVATTGTVIGSQDCTAAFWSVFSDTTAVADGESVTVNFTNWTSGLNNWNNFLVVLQNVPDVHAVEDDADYAEYAVLRADNYGWGAGYEGIAEATCDWDWDTFLDVIDGADVTLTVSLNDGEATVEAVVAGTDGNTYTQTYSGIAVDGDLYFCLTTEGGFLDIQ